MEKAGPETIYLSSQRQWRNWLQKNHSKQQAVWLIFYKKNLNVPTMIWSDAVDEALCFGWIDSIRKTIDEQRFVQFFSKRKAKSTWSKINKEKVKQLIAADLMMPAGLQIIEMAKQNGSWAMLDEVEEVLIPKDLDKAFKARPGSKQFFLSLSRSVRKMILQWIVLAKREETRQKRILEIADRAALGLRPVPFS